MSKTYGIEFLRNRGRKPGAKIPSMEHFRGLSRETVKHLTGRDPLIDKDHITEIYQQLGRVLDIDLNWGEGFPAPFFSPTGTVNISSRSTRRFSPR